MFDQKSGPLDDSVFPATEQALPAARPATGQTGPLLASDLMPTGQPQVKPKSGSLNISASSLGQAQDIFNDEEVPSESGVMPNLPAGRQGLASAVQAAEAQFGSETVGPSDPLSELPDDLDSEPGHSKKLVWVGLGALIFLLAIGGYLAFAKLFGKSSSDKILTPSEFNKKLQEEVTNLDLSNQKKVEPNQESRNENQIEGQPSQEEASEPVQEEAEPPLDSDKDGLTDDAENALGTDPNEADSDGDALYDKEEAKVYQTNPLNPDTDGDGFLDGEEVRNGYNPKGQGRLLPANFQE